MSVHPAPVLSVQSLLARGCRAHLLGHSRRLGSPRALCVCVPPELQARGRSRSLVAVAASGQRPGRATALASDSSCRASLGGTATLVHCQLLPCPTHAVPGSCSPAFLLAPHHSAHPGPASPRCSCQGTASTHRRLLLTRRKKNPNDVSKAS